MENNGLCRWCLQPEHPSGTICSKHPDFGAVSEEEVRRRLAAYPSPSKQRAIDISNLRFYSAMAHDFKWQTDIIHWSVISKTLEEIADRLAETHRELAIERSVSAQLAEKEVAAAIRAEDAERARN